MLSKNSSLSSGSSSQKVYTNNRNRYVANLGCIPDNIAVALLPDDWVPKHSGPILTNYLIRRKQEHNKIHEDILKNAAAANSEVDAKIYMLSEILLSHINQNQQDMDCVVDKCQEQEEILSDEDCIVAFKDINDLSLKRLDDLATFKHDATFYEKQRAEKLKIILRDNFQRLVNVAHLNPKDLLYDFDQRIYEINQQLLNNSRAFLELETRLRAQLDENVVQVKSNVNQLSLGIHMEYRRRQSHSLVRHTLIENISQRQLIRNKSHDSCKFNLVTNEQLTVYMNQLVQVYHTAVLALYSGYHKSLLDLEKELRYRNVDITAFPDLENLTVLSKLCLSSNGEWSSSNITKSKAASLQKNLLSLGEMLRHTYLILYEAGHLWDAHILRAAYAQKLTIAAVEDLLTIHDATELADEIPINIALEHLRTSPDKDHLDKLYHTIMNMLAKTAEMYLQHSESELKRLEEYVKFSTSMTSVLQSEFNMFLEKYCPDTTIDMPNESLRTFNSTMGTTDHLPLSRATLQTELQEAALNNWRNGFFESFRNNISSLPDELKHQSLLWIEERSTSLNMRYSLKMISHDIRKERVKAIKERRLAELVFHEQRLESHLTAVSNLIQKLPTEVSEFGSIDAPDVYPLVNWVDRLKVSVTELLAEDHPDHLKMKLKMTSYSMRLPKYRLYFEESLEKVFDNFKNQLRYRVHEVRISNVRFLSQLKLFHEGGTYAAQEATRASMMITKAFDTLENTSNKLPDLLKNRQSYLLHEADRYMASLSQHLESHSKKPKSQTKMPKTNNKAKPKK